MPDPQDVQPDSSPAPTDTPTQTQPDASGQQAVASDAPQDRPWENVKAEWSRKFGSLESKLDQALSAFAQMAARPAPQQSQTREYTTDELAQLAAAGNADAIKQLSQRQAIEAATMTQAAASAQQATTAQLSQFLTLYPELKQADHPLAQAALTLKQQYLRAGYQDSDAVRLQAVKDALVANPELVAQVVQTRKAPEVQRQSGARAQSAIDGATHRRQPNQAQVPKLDPKAAEIARRMGVKDPEKSLERFYKRQEQGKSAVDPRLVPLIREEG